MLSFLFSLLLWRNPTGGGGAIQAMRFPRWETPLLQLIFLVAAALITVGVLYAYRKEPDYLATPRRRLLAGLRLASAAVILFILSGAFIEVTRSEDSKGTLLVLVDASQSMGIKDRRPGAEQDAIKRIIGGASGPNGAKLDPAAISRTDLVRAAFANPDYDLIAAVDQRFKVETYTFGQAATLQPLEVSPVGSGGRFAKLGEPGENATQLGGALIDAARRAKGRTLDGVVVLTDGGSNRGEDPVAAAKALGAPVWAVGVGEAQARDLEIPFLYCDDVVFKDDRFLLNVRIRQRGYSGKTATLVVKRIDEHGAEDVVKEEQIDLTDQLEFMHMVELVPDREGVFNYSAELTPFPDEANTANNKRVKANVKVVDKKIRVLLVEDTPRWDFRFLKAILDADRQRVAPTVILRQGDAIEEGSFPGGNPRHLRQFPSTLNELRSYDVVVLGDVPADFVSGDQLTALEQFVREDGGGLIVVAGRKAMPSEFMDTPLANLLPVEPDPQSPQTAEEEMSHTIKLGFKPQVTPDGERWPALHLPTSAADPAESLAEWNKADSLFWYLPSRRIKPGATVLMVHPDQKLGEQPMPLMASQRYGKGQVLYLATDESWRWRFHPGAAAHRAMWGQLISALAMAHLMGAGERNQIDTDRGEYAVGDRAQVIARLFDANFNPVTSDSVTITAERELQHENITLSPKKDQPGVYTGEWVPGAQGRWRLTVDNDPASEHLVSVVDPHIEFDDPGMRQELLTRIGTVSGGKYLPLEELPTLAKDLTSRTRTATVFLEERTLWNAPGIMVLLALLLGAEWFLRKRSDLM
jgi:uncharacterized membrane protein